MSQLEVKHIKQAVVGGTTQPLKLGGISTDGSDAKVTISTDGSVSLPSTTSIGAVSSTELGYLDGVTSNLQTQLNGMIGVGQSYQDLTSSRSAGVTYTNTTGKPIQIIISATVADASTNYIYCNGTIILDGSTNTGMSMKYVFGAIIPNGATYAVTASDGIVKWFEIR